MFDKLSVQELQLLIIFTLFDTSETSPSKIKGAVEKMQGRMYNDMNRHISTLRSKGLIGAYNWNWRTDSYDYLIEDDYLIPSMLYIYQNHPDLVKNVMDAVGSKLKPNDIQRLLWKFITSDFTKLDIEHIDEFELSANVDVLKPVVGDWRFAPVLLMLDKEDFTDLISDYLEESIEDLAVIPSDGIRKVIEAYQFKGVAGAREDLLCYLDLYDYLANGIVSKNLLAANRFHRIVAGIHEAYHGNHKAAFEHFKKAVTLNNKSGGRYSSSKSYLPLSIVNFFYVIVSYLQGTDDGKKKAQAIIKANHVEVNDAARVLFNIIYNVTNDRQTVKALQELRTDMNKASMILSHLMELYLGKSGLKKAPSDWLIMKHEVRKYIPLDDDTAAKCNAAYGDRGLLSSIYHKQEWEAVLEDLMGISGDSGKVVEQKDTRICYTMGQTTQYSVSVRQQTMLKSGSWSAGKAVPMQNFFSGMVEGMNADDRAIAAQVKRMGIYSYDFPLSVVLPYMTENSRLYVGRYAPYTLVDVTEEMPYITLHHDDSGFVITSNVPLEKIDSGIIITHRGSASINFINLTDSQRPFYKRLLSLGHFPNEAEDQLRAFLKGIGGRIEVNSDLIEGGSTLPMTDGNSQLVLQLRPVDKETYDISLFVRPLEGGKIRCIPGEGNEIIVDGMGETRTRVKRDLQQEKEHLEHLVTPHPMESEQVQAADEATEDTKTKAKAAAKAKEENVLPALQQKQLDQILHPGSSSYSGTTISVDGLLPLVEYAARFPEHISCEWPEGAKMRVKQRQSGSWSGAIKKNDNGWFEIEGSVELDQGKVVTMAELLELANQSHGRFIKLGEGEFLALSDKLRRQLDQLSIIASKTRGRLQISPFSAALIGPDTLDGELMLSEDDELKAIRQRILEASTYSPHVPNTLNATLRNYQKDGYQWMMRLNKWGAGALLADDMGLGKTIQTITFLLAKAKEGPALVVAPASVAPNWKTELEKFAPSLKVTMLNFVGDRRDAIEHAKENCVVVTTYGLLLSVKDEITKKHWTTICLDEAHIIKNRGAKTSAVAMQLHSDNRIMLTGTPVQNYLGELWNLFQFVNPGLLGSFESFSRNFITPIEQGGDKERQHDLDRLVKPFMLRRTKSKVAKELPEKEEIYQHVDLTEDEKLIYEAMRQKAEALLLAEAGNKVSMNTLAEITRLRQCACDSRLVTPDAFGNTGAAAVGANSNGTEAAEPQKPRRGRPPKNAKKEEKDGIMSKIKSAIFGDKSETETQTTAIQGSKITALVELLQTILESNDNENGVLVFSQFTSYLTLVQRALKDAKIPYLYIDGSVPVKRRTELVNDFQNGRCQVFLISLKAGGLGLNLTRANYVVHMDPWWNPAIEAQATDRAHRIGQKQHVTVYHLIASGTIEEKIQRLHERKRNLANDILESTDSSHKLTGEELLEMVRG